jgi:hypothetical protein
VNTNKIIELMHSHVNTLFLLPLAVGFEFIIPNPANPACRAVVFIEGGLSCLKFYIFPYSTSTSAK